MQKTADQLIEEVSALVKGIWAHSENPELLSKHLNEIAVLNWALAKHRADFTELEQAMKAELDLAKATSIMEYTNAGDAVNKAEIRTTIKLMDKRIAYNRMAANVDKIKVMMQANDRVMDAARSRLSLIKEEIKRWI